MKFTGIVWNGDIRTEYVNNDVVNRERKPVAWLYEHMGLLACLDCGPTEAFNAPYYSTEVTPDDYCEKCGAEIWARPLGIHKGAFILEGIKFTRPYLKEATA